MISTRIHFSSAVLQERAVLRTGAVHAHRDLGHTHCRALIITDHRGEEVRLPLDDLGRALRKLGVSAKDLGYEPRRYKA